MSKLYAKLKNTVDTRRQAKKVEYDDMFKLTEVYEGDLPAEYVKFFPKNTPRHEVNFIEIGRASCRERV